MVFPQDLIIALVLIIGLVGTVVQVMPGTLIVAGAILAWAILTGGTAAWVIFALAVLVLLTGTVLKFVVAGAKLKRAEVRNHSVVIGLVAGAVLFFVIPVLGLFVGFIGGVYLSELARTGTHARAWPATVVAIKATALTIIVEFGSALVATGLWIVGLIIT
ncbi:DUF456 domain-containing protein [Timonella senegalensis]|uniref:DUF456 domain-containing protein n=1 Tax=Timonella senegalensis TaxID=1465825 RepID=UPI0028A8944E|nr:DUF456 domain-containing protein [Timonella senegalensis]